MTGCTFFTPKVFLHCEGILHFGKFISFLADLSAFLNRLLKKDAPFHWSAECEDGFNRIKEALTLTEVLAHFDPKVPLGLACDASTISIGAVLYHRYENGMERPIAYASKTLTKAEQNYSQIKREVLSLVYGVKKFHQYIFSYKFTLLMDHKPLLKIFGTKSGIPVMTANRLQRWAIILSVYTYTCMIYSISQPKNMGMLTLFSNFQSQMMTVLRRIKV